MRTKDARIGKFSISGKLIFDNKAASELKSLIFSKMIILRAEYLGWEDIIEYTAICDDFDKIEAGALPPIYSIVFNKINNIYTKSEFKREA